MPQIDDKTSNRWKTVRVFISSTFRDMHAERDHLVRFVFPRLREELLKRRIHLVDVDLRWGVTSEQDASEVCREIINECRPRFLCMLGGRYGWMPPGKTRSITADEVHYGVLDRTQKERGFAYFYFRDDTATAAMVETTPGEFREPQGSDNQKKLAALKQAIITAGINPFVYQAHWDNETGRLTGLKQFGDRVYDDLLASMKSDTELQDRFVMDTVAQPDEFSEENMAMEAFVEEHYEHFVLGSRKSVLYKLIAHARSTGDNGYVCVTGASGSGKSALLAHLYKHLISLPEFRQSTIIIAHFVGASSGSSDMRRTLRRLCHELKANCPDINTDIPDEPEKLHIVFPVFLRQACAKKNVLILLDAINQFVPASNSAGLHWLPEELTGNARVILFTIAGPALEELRCRLVPPKEMDLEPLTTDDGEAIIEQFRKRYHKRFTSEQRSTLLAKTDACMPLYLLAALEELRTLGTYEEISDRIKKLPGKTQKLFIWILKRLESDKGFRDADGCLIGDEIVRKFVSFIGVSRCGLSQMELFELIAMGSPNANPPIPSDPQGNVAALMRLLRSYLIYRGELINFYHDQFIFAIKTQYVSKESNYLDAHQTLAKYFRNKADPSNDETWRGKYKRAFTEIPYHLYCSGKHENRKKILKSPYYLEAIGKNAPEMLRRLKHDPTLTELTDGGIYFWEDRAIYNFGIPKYEDLFAKVKSKDVNSRIMAIRTLASLDDSRVIPVLLQALNDNNINNLEGSLSQSDEEEAIFVSSQAATLLVSLGYASCNEDVYRRAASEGYPIVICADYYGPNGLLKAREYCLRLYEELRKEHVNVRICYMFAE